MNIEEIIKKSINKLNYDIELRNSLYLSIIHRNIDSLVSQSPVWFKEGVPKEFIEILNSLINLSVILADRARKSTELLFEHSYEEFYPYKIIERIKQDFLELLTFTVFEIDTDPEITLITSKQVFRDSLYHIFFCISQFITDSSECYVSLTSSQTSHTLLIRYSRLSPSTPDIRTLLRLFFVSDMQGQMGETYDMNIKVGLNIAVENIRRIGGLIHIDKPDSQAHNLDIKISFPSKEFIDTINDVRKYAFVDKNKNRSGTVILSFIDKMTELLVSESMRDAGYSIQIEHISKIKFLEDLESAKSIITDYENIEKNFSTIQEFSDIVSGRPIIIILKKEKELPGFEGDNIRIVTIPFEIDCLLELIN